MIKKIILLGLVCLVLAGCGNPRYGEYATQQAESNKAYYELAKAQIEAMTELAKNPSTGPEMRGMLGFALANFRTALALLKAPEFDPLSKGLGKGIEGMLPGLPQAALNALGYFAIADTAKEGIKGAGSAFNMTNDVSGGSSAGGVIGGGTASPSAATSPPTVVYQPEPVVVQQPAPIVVNSGSE